MDLPLGQGDSGVEVSPGFLPPNSATRPAGFITMVWLPASLAIIVVGLRLFARISRRAASWDDLLITASLISYLCAAGFATKMWQSGFGQHVLDLDYTQLTGIAKWTIASQIAITLGPAFAKMSACVFILRMIKQTQRRVSIFLFALMGVLLLVAIATILTWCFQCIPLKKFWTPFSVGVCVRRIVFVSIFQGYNVVGVITDFACAILPIFILRGLQISHRRKTELYILMGLAMFPGICCIFKTIDTIHYNDADFSYKMVPGVYWIILELSSGIIIASMPTLHGMTCKACSSLSSLSLIRVAITVKTKGSSQHSRSTFSRADTPVNKVTQLTALSPASTAAWNREYRHPRDTLLLSSPVSLACPAACNFCRSYHFRKGAGMRGFCEKSIMESIRDKPLPLEPLSDDEDDMKIEKHTSVRVFSEAGLDLEAGAFSEKELELMHDFRRFGLL